MKKILSILSITVVMAACSSNQDKIDAENLRLKAYQDSINMASDTAGLADFQQWKAQNELGEQQNASAVAPVRNTTAARKTTSTARRSTASSARGGSGTSTSTTAAKKEGWSKTAKGAVIGGVVGAGAGAVINKKNRAAGAVIGGVVGAGAGAVIGRKADKKDGRY